MKIDLLIIALGNPGEEYKNTRHNAGFIVGEALCAKYKAQIKPSKSKYYFAEFKIKGRQVGVIFPTTYMNNSGLAVKEIMEKNSIPIDNMLAIIDEYNFPVGKIHLKKGGSDGGHNGMYSLIFELESEDFYRLRFGIDRKFEQGGLVDYVLSKFNEDEKPALNKAVEDSIKAIEHIIDMGLHKAMSGINSGKLFIEKEVSASTDAK